MTNYLNNFQSLFEISIALNFAFIALTAISDKIKVLFEHSVEHRVEKTLAEIKDFEDKSNIYFEQGEIDTSQKKRFEEKIQDIKSNITSLQKRFFQIKEDIFNSLIDASKNFYIIVANYAIFILFFSGHLSSKVACSYLSFSIFTFAIAIFILFEIFKANKLSLFQTPMYISLLFVFILGLPYIANIFAADLCNTLNTFFYLHHKSIVYLSVAILFFPISYSLYRLNNGHQKLSKNFEEEIKKIMHDEKELEANIEAIIEKEKLAKQAQDAADKLRNDLANKLNR